MKISWKYTFFLLIIILPFVYAAFFCVPLGDDFARSNIAQGLFDWGNGIIEVRGKWSTWSGRYFHHFIVIFLGDSIKSSLGYAVVCLGVLAITLVSLYGIFSQLCGTHRQGTVVFLATGGLVTLLTAHQALNITYYVVTDSLGIGLGNSLVLLHICALCYLWYSPKIHFVIVGLPCLTSFLAIGCYEHSAIATLLASGAALWFARESRHPFRRAFYYVFVATCICFFVSFLAPGNFRRQHVRNVTNLLMIAQLKQGIHDWARYSFQIFLTPYVVYAIIAGLAVIPCRRRSDVQPVSIKKQLFICSILFVLLTGMIILVQALSDQPIEMTIKLPQSMMLLCAYLITFANICISKYIFGKNINISPALVLIPFFIITTLSNNVLLATSNAVNGSLKQAGMAQYNRGLVLNESKRKDVTIAPFTVLPFPAVFSQVFSLKQNEWPNQDASIYYGARSIVLQKIDATQTFNTATSIAPLPWNTDSSGASFCLVNHIGSCPNKTYDLDFIFVKIEANMFIPKEIHIVFTSTPGSGHNNWFFKILYSLVIPNTNLTRNWVTDCLTMRRDYILDRNTEVKKVANENAANIFVLPLTEHTANKVDKVYISYDGKSYHKIIDNKL